MEKLPGWFGFLQRVRVVSVTCGRARAEVSDRFLLLGLCSVWEEVTPVEAGFLLPVSSNCGRCLKILEAGKRGAGCPSVG